MTLHGCVMTETTYCTTHAHHEVLTWLLTALCSSPKWALPWKPWLLLHWGLKQHRSYVIWGYVMATLWLCYSNVMASTLPAMAPHSSTLAWRIPWTEEPSGLKSMGLLRVGHNWATSLSLSIFMHWRRKWPPTPVFLPGDSQGWGSLVGCRLWGHIE